MKCELKCYFVQRFNAFYSSLVQNTFLSAVVL